MTSYFGLDSEITSFPTPAGYVKEVLYMSDEGSLTVLKPAECKKSAGELALILNGLMEAEIAKAGIVVSDFPPKKPS